MKSNTLKILLLAITATFSINCFAAGATLEQSDTMYHFAKSCEKDGMSTYYTDRNNQYQHYSSADIYSQYKYMLDMLDIGSLSMFESTNSVSKADMLNYLAKTRARRTRVALDQDFLMCE